VVPATASLVRSVIGLIVAHYGSFFTRRYAQSMTAHILLTRWRQTGSLMDATAIRERHHSDGLATNTALLIPICGYKDSRFRVDTRLEMISVLYLFHYSSLTRSTKRKYNNYTKINTNRLQMEEYSTYIAKTCIYNE